VARPSFAEHARFTSLAWVAAFVMQALFLAALVRPPKPLSELPKPPEPEVEIALDEISFEPSSAANAARKGIAQVQSEQVPTADPARVNLNQVLAKAEVFVQRAETPQTRQQPPPKPEPQVQHEAIAQAQPEPLSVRPEIVKPSTSTPAPAIAMRVEREPPPTKQAPSTPELAVTLEPTEVRVSNATQLLERESAPIPINPPDAMVAPVSRQGERPQIAASTSVIDETVPEPVEKFEPAEIESRAEVTFARPSLSTPTSVELTPSRPPARIESVPLETPRAPVELSQNRPQVQQSPSRPQLLEPRAALPTEAIEIERPVLQKELTQANMRPEIRFTPARPELRTSTSAPVESLAELPREAPRASSEVLARPSLSDDVEVVEDSPATAANTSRPSASGSEQLLSDRLPGRPDGLNLSDAMSAAAAAEVADGQSQRGDQRSAFRRYNDPFDDDSPQYLKGLRMRDPVGTAEVLKFLLAALGGGGITVQDRRVTPGTVLSTNVELGPDQGISDSELVQLYQSWLQKHGGELNQACAAYAHMPPEVHAILCMPQSEQSLEDFE
jgi:hypothetical protein